MRAKILDIPSVKVTLKLFGGFGMNQYEPLINAWEKMETDFPLTIPDLLMVILAISTLIATGLGVM